MVFPPFHYFLLFLMNGLSSPSPFLFFISGYISLEMLNVWGCHFKAFYSYVTKHLIDHGSELI